MIVKLELPIELTKEDEHIIAICPVFCVGSQGTTEEEALTNAREALELFLEDKDVQKEYADKILEYAVSFILEDKEKEFKDKHSLSDDTYENPHITKLDVKIHGYNETSNPVGV